MQQVTVAGAGILGLWQALTLARVGFRVHVLEASSAPFTGAASRWAGAMLAPDCEAELAEPIVRELGHIGLRLWRETYPGVVDRGTLVVAPARDLSELARFERATQGHRRLVANEIATLEPALDGRYQSALYFAGEAHVATPAALAFLLKAAQAAGVHFALNERWDGRAIAGQIVIDARGFGARSDIKNLRGVRGERVVLRTRDLQLTRPVRLLHPRHPLYVVPWGDGLYMIGATMIESDDAGPMTARSALELLGLAYALHPGFGEAEIVDMGAGVRPAFPSNTPQILAETNNTVIRVNGAYRHGFLLAPVLAHMVRDYLTTGTRDPRMLTVS